MYNVRIIFSTLYRANFTPRYKAQKRIAAIFIRLILQEENSLLHLYTAAFRWLRMRRTQKMYISRAIFRENTLDVCTAQIACDKNDVWIVLFFYYFMRWTARTCAGQYARSAISRVAFEIAWLCTFLSCVSAAFRKTSISRIK